METADKGNATEAAVLAALAARGFEVMVPFGDGHAYDLAVHLGEGCFARIQCKTGRLTDDCISFNTRTIDHGRGRQPYLGLADVFGIYFLPSDAVYLVPVAEACGFVARLRLKPPKNNQRRGIRLAVDYLIDEWSAETLRRVVGATSAPGVTEGPLRVA